MNDEILKSVLKKVDEFNSTGDVPPVDTPFAFGKSTSSEKGSRKGSRYIGKEYPKSDTKKKIKKIKDKWYMAVEELATENNSRRYELKIKRIFSETIEMLNALEVLVNKTSDKTLLNKLKRQYNELDGIVNRIGYNIIN